MVSRERDRGRACNLYRSRKAAVYKNSYEKKKEGKKMTTLACAEWNEGPHGRDNRRLVTPRASKLSKRGRAADLNHRRLRTDLYFYQDKLVEDIVLVFSKFRP